MKFFLMAKKKKHQFFGTWNIFVLALFSTNSFISVISGSITIDWLSPYYRHFFFFSCLSTCLEIFDWRLVITFAIFILEPFVFCSGFTSL